MENQQQRPEEQPSQAAEQPGQQEPSATVSVPEAKTINEQDDQAQQPQANLLTSGEKDDSQAALQNVSVISSITADAPATVTSEQSDHEKSSHEKSDHEQSDHEKSDHEKSDHEKSDHEKSDHEKSEHSASHDQDHSSDSDSDDESHALEKSVTKIRSTRSGQDLGLDQSVHGLSVILSEEMAEKRFPILKISQLLNQKGQMRNLNEILKVYMKNNMDLDKTIQELAEEIEKSLKARKEKEGEINGLIREINTTKVEVVNNGDQARQSEKEARILSLKNRNLEKECQRAEFEINALKLKIEALNHQIEDCNEEIETDRKDIEQLEPEKEKLKKEKDEMTNETRIQIIELLRRRKRNFMEPFPEFSPQQPAKDLEKLLIQYRKECLKEKAGEEPDDLKQLRKAVALQEAKERELTDDIKRLEQAEDSLNLNYLHLHAEIKVTQSQIEEVNKLISSNKINYTLELNRLDNYIEELTKKHVLLQKAKEEADEYLLRVLLKDIGKKERIDEELKNMGIMLDWRLVKVKERAKQAEEEFKAPPTKKGAKEDSPGDRSSSSSIKSTGSRGSQKSQRGRRGGRK